MLAKSRGTADGRDVCSWCEVDHVRMRMGGEDIADFFYEVYG